MTTLVVGLLKVDKNKFGADASNRMAEFGLSVQQANATLKAQMGGAEGVRILVAPEYYWSGYDQIGHHQKQHGPLAMDRDSKHQIYAGLKAISSQAGSLVLVAGSIFYQKPDGARTAAFNVCPVLRNGQFVLKAYKEFDDGAAKKNPGRYNYDTKDSDPYFKVEDIRFGLEVCGDHDNGTNGGKLKTWTTATGKSIDVQILVSDSSHVLANSVVATKYVVQCDIGGTAAVIAVYPAGGPYAIANSIAATGIGGTQVNGAVVYYYKLAV
jgi:predicted amidohydrolase